MEKIYKTRTNKCELCGKTYKYPSYYDSLREKVCASCESFYVHLNMFMLINVASYHKMTGKFLSNKELIEKLDTFTKLKEDGENRE